MTSQTENISVGSTQSKGTGGRAWMLRPTPHGYDRTAQFIEGGFSTFGNGLIAVGWPHIGDLADAKKRSAIKKRILTHYKKYSPNALGAAAGTIYRFKEEIQIGDLIFMPEGQAVYIGRVASDYYYVPSLDLDTEGYCHQRAIEWLFEKKAIPRSLLTGRLFNAMKGRQTLVILEYEDVKELVENKSYLFTEENTQELKQEYLKNLQDSSIYGINHSRFEDGVRIVLQNYFPGLLRQSTRGSETGDTDLLAEIPGGLNIRIQVKYYNGELGDRPVTQVADSMDIEDVGYVVTSGEIGEKAIKEAESQLLNKGKRVRFIDGKEFVDLLFENISSIDEADLPTLGLRKKTSFL